MVGPDRLGVGLRALVVRGEVLRESEERGTHHLERRVTVRRGAHGFTKRVATAPPIGDDDLTFGFDVAEERPFGNARRLGDVGGGRLGVADGYHAFYNPGGPGPEPNPDVRYTAPGPPDLDLVVG